MKTAIILGANSDIAQALIPELSKDYTIFTWARGQSLPYVPWDLVIISIGKVAPVGLWHEQGHERWDETFKSNLLLPAKLLRRLWPMRQENAKVSWFAGSNPNAIMDGYSAYNVSKMAVLKFVEQIDHEYPDVTVFALGPGVTDTKIHNATKEAKWPNPRLERAMIDGSFTPIERIYACMKWCLEQPKKSVGGRNICVSDPWDSKPFDFGKALEANPNMYKLRRAE